jgi:hypothetical protein
MYWGRRLNISTAYQKNGKTHVLSRTEEYLEFTVLSKMWDSVDVGINSFKNIPNTTRAIHQSNPSLLPPTASNRTQRRTTQTLLFREKEGPRNLCKFLFAPQPFQRPGIALCPSAYESNKVDKCTNSLTFIRFHTSSFIEQ